MLEDVLKKSLDNPRSYLIRGDKESIKEELFKAMESVWNFVPIANPDVMQVNGHLSVEEARTLVEFASLSPFSADGLKVIILSAERATREAQNTLLKLTEEPNKYLRIFVIVPKDVELLPTLLSRLEDISHAFSLVGSGIKTDAGNFLSMGLKERLKLAEKIAKDEDETTLDAFLRDLEKKVYKHKYKNNLEKEKFFNALVFAKNISASQSRPKRLILESLAISLPVL